MFWFILFLILLYFIAAPIFRVWRKMRRFRNEYEQAMNQQGNYQPGHASDTRTDEQREMVERYRRYSEENAENVDYEELEGRMEEKADNTSAQQEPSSQYQEEAISDAEYEEI
ncbi:MAG: hypothetical protein IJR20_05235 [Muribaculaceae bacterium]|nr:hypothetical protein [Muribaculaceae bacterium]